MKAQGTIEYLVILAIIVVVSLVVVSLITTSTNPAGISVGESKIYWQAQPLAITEAAIDSEGDGKLVIKNNTGELIEIIEVLVDGEPILFENGTLSYDGKLVLHAQYLEGCIDQGSYEIEITYKTENDLIKKVSGDMPLIVDCDQDIEKLFLEAGVVLTTPTNNGVGIKNQNFEFNVSGSDINQCTLISNDISGDYNVVGSELSGEQTISVSGLTGMGANYEWNVECCNIRGECARADNNYTFVIPNQAPTVTYIAPNSGTYAGSVPIQLSVKDDDGAVSELTAKVYYSTSPGLFPDENYAGSFDLASTCFSDNNFYDLRDCNIDWFIDDPNLSGNYYIDVNVFDGERSTLVSSTNPIFIDNCTVPTVGLSISEDTDFCSGNYPLDNPGGTILSVSASGNSSDPLTINCHGASLSGDATYGVNMIGRSYVEIKNCGIKNYSTSIYMRGNYNKIIDSNFSGSSGKGIHHYSGSGTFNGNEFIRNDFSGRDDGVFFSSARDCRYELANFYDLVFKENNFENIGDGIDRGGCIRTYNAQFENNDFNNVSGWAIDLYSWGNETTITSDNKFVNLNNGIALGNDNIISNLDLSDTAGTAVYIQGSNNIISDNNLSGSGGKGIYHYSGSGNFYNNKILRNDFSGRDDGILFSSSRDCRYELANFYNHTIEDNNFYNVIDGFDKGGCIRTYDLNVFGNDFNNISGWAIDLYGWGHRTNISKDNLFENINNGIALGSNNKIDSLKMSNVDGIAIYLQGSGNSVTNNDIFGNSSAKGVYLSGAGNPTTYNDLNISNNDFVGVGNGIFIYSTRDCRYQLVYYEDLNVSDNNFFNNVNGIAYSNCAKTKNFSLENNTFYGSSSWAASLPPGATNGFVKENDFNMVTNGLNIHTHTIVDGVELDSSRISNIPIQINGRYNVVKDSNVSGSGSGIGIRAYIRGGSSLNPSNRDNNIIRVDMSNREYGLQFYSTYRAYFSDYFINDSKFNNNSKGIGQYGQIYGIFRVKPKNNEFRNNVWPVHLSSGEIEFDETNDLQNSSNGILFKNNSVIENIDFKDENVMGIAVYIQGRGSHNIIRNLNIEGDGTGDAIFLYLRGGNMSDNNFSDITIKNKSSGIRFYNNTCHVAYQRYGYNFNIKNSLFENNSYGIKYDNCSTTDGIKIQNNIFLNNGSGVRIRASNYYLNQNDFINNSLQMYSTGVPSDANYNYWSDNSACPNSYTFSNGTDYSPSCTSIN